MKKKRIIRLTVLAAVFVAAVAVLSYITNRGNADMTADMGEAALPRIAFVEENYEINELAGYADEMNLTSMRDTITPAADTGTLQVKIKRYEQKIEKLTYEVYTLDGQTKLLEGEIKEPESTVDLSLAEVWKTADEAVLKITLKPKQHKSVHYYTRIVKSEGLAAKECLDFVNKFHEDAIGKKETAFISDLIETDTQTDSMGIQHVTMNSDIKQIQWGSLSPEVVKDVSIYVTEARETYSSILLRYQIKSKGDLDQEDIYNVNEFFRVRSSKGKMYLLSYDRTMNEVFDGSEKVLTENGITLGITPADVQYKSNSEGNITAFVQEREVWTYNKEQSELARVFSFAASEENDPRNLYDQHEVKLIDIDKNGNTTFAVLGYMNRGAHEGEVGAAIYYYSMEKNSVEEKVFIPSSQSYGIASHELGELVYYSQEENAVYVMNGGSLYKADLASGEKETLVKDLKETQYASSEDGHLLAYQSNGSLYDATSIIVLNLKSGKQNEVTAQEGDSIRPLGFVYDDFIYGMSKKSDEGKIISGETVVPMYQLEIRDKSNEPAKTYQAEGTYISAMDVAGNMITLHRLTRNQDVYIQAPDEYITNNQEKEVGNITIETFSTDIKGTQSRIRFEDGIKDQSPNILKPKQVLFEKPKLLEFESTEEAGAFCVYGKGKLLGIYEKVSEAILTADTAGGVVTSRSQQYVWERGNRDLSYQIELENFRTSGEESTLAACINAIVRLEGKEGSAAEGIANREAPLKILSELSEGQGMDLTGCSVEELLYVISKGTPVIAMTDAEHAILLTGYQSTKITYVDPAEGKTGTITADDLTERTAPSGNTYFSYLK